jgi:peptidoglycan hydrolase-like protein with peptidoglycan-binding domain
LTSDGSGTATMARQVTMIEGVSRIVWFGQSGRPALPAPGYLNHVLSPGATDSAQVRVLQTRLSELGYDVHGIDGVFGPAKDSAVRAYQANPAQHRTADGVVRAATGISLVIWR